MELIELLELLELMELMELLKKNGKSLTHSLTTSNQEMLAHLKRYLHT